MYLLLVRGASINIAHDLDEIKDNLLMLKTSV